MSKPLLAALLPLVITVTLGTCIAWLNWQRTPESWALLRNADRVTLYALDPTSALAHAWFVETGSETRYVPESALFHGHEILARKELEDGTGRGEVERALARSLRTARWNKMCATAPHHALRFEHEGRIVDALIDVSIGERIEFLDASGTQLECATLEPSCLRALQRHAPEGWPYQVSDD